MAHTICGSGASPSVPPPSSEIRCLGAGVRRHDLVVGTDHEHRRTVAVPGGLQVDRAGDEPGPQPPGEPAGHGADELLLGEGEGAPALVEERDPAPRRAVGGQAGAQFVGVVPERREHLRPPSRAREIAPGLGAERRHGAGTPGHRPEVVDVVDLVLVVRPLEVVLVVDVAPLDRRGDELGGRVEGREARGGERERPPQRLDRGRAERRPVQARRGQPVDLIAHPLGAHHSHVTQRSTGWAGRGIPDSWEGGTPGGWDGRARPDGARFCSCRTRSSSPRRGSTRPPGTRPSATTRHNSARHHSSHSPWPDRGLSTRTGWSCTRAT